MNAQDAARLGLGTLTHYYGLFESMYEDHDVQPWPVDMNYNNEQHRFGQVARQWNLIAGRGSEKWNNLLDEFNMLGFTLDPTFGIYSAVRQYSFGDYVFSFLGFLGLAIPNFLFALVLMYFASVYFGSAIGGLMASEYLDQPWSWAKVGSVMQHIWVPIIVIGTAGTAQMIRLLRANMLDELQKQYVVTARAKGLPEWKVIAKYPLRLAVNPFIANIGSILPQVISGGAIVAFVLDRIDQRSAT